MTETTAGITTGAVARRLGVSPTTLRSWDQRYGIGPAAREDGRHRRWSPSDVGMLEEMCRLTTSGVPPAEAARVARARAGRHSGQQSGQAAGQPAGQVSGQPAGSRSEQPAPGRTPPPPASAPGSGNGLPLTKVHQEFRGLARAAVRLDSPAMDTLLRDLVAEHGLVTSWEEAMAPTLHAVGRKWESSGDRYVEVEHLLSWHISTALRQLVSSARPHRADANPVLLACVPAEQHTLPIEALAAGLAERGLPTRMFGAAVPAEALDSAVRRLGPTAVVLWSQSRSTASHALARHVADISFGVRGARTHSLVLLAGPGWAGRATAPGMLRPGGLREALDILVHRCATDSRPGAVRDAAR
ncbi:cobalamin B12-binding domain-containing protein [Streptomyces sp. Je 1-79]|uniref:cobalamin B12-binding domain-containing protein n=1 Tax=Streptomyces sp. Je 1-79 TaxID=2943847 RepID=UPI0021A4FCD9|nr:cobalamin B12-binding domain-containing protein [Streptomyces sp. Je 1-79]MCT4351842.1 cobalamin B12-binding domain-containing protein [Streptomyces sp. Je 1-79]